MSWLAGTSASLVNRYVTPRPDSPTCSSNERTLSVAMGEGHRQARRHVAAAADLADDQALEHQARQRLAHRGAGRPEALGQLAVGRHPVAHGQFAGLDAVTHLLLDLQVDGGEPVRGLPDVHGPSYHGAPALV